MNKLSLFTIFTLAFTYNVQASPSPSTNTAKVVSEYFQDIDKDGTNEKIIVVNTGLEDEAGNNTLTLVFKKNNKKWEYMRKVDKWQLWNYRNTFKEE